MGIQGWTYLFIFITFSVYVGIAIWSRVMSTRGFYVAGGTVHPLANGAATAADWMSAASFISMAGIISFLGRDGSVYLMGWTGGYVLLALLLAPYLRKFGQYTVPDFVGERYYSKTARLVAVICAIFISFTYVTGQMRGVGVVFSRFLEIEIFWGVFIGMVVVFTYAVLGGMKGITYTQVAQYCVLIFAYLLPAIFIAITLTGNVIPQIGFGAEVKGEEGVFLLDRLNGLNRDLGFSAYTSGSKSTIDVFFITAALMVGTAGLPHVIIRFFTVPKVSDARLSAFWALLFIAILYLTAPAVAAFARTNFLQTVSNTAYSEAPEWFKNWESTGLIKFEDKNGDGIMQYYNDENPAYASKAQSNGWKGNEITVDRDIMVLANPEIARLPNWVIALVAAGGLAAALSTAAGLLLVISSAISHDLLKRMLLPQHNRIPGVDCGAHCGGSSSGDCGIFRGEPARLRGQRGGLCLRAGRGVVLSRPGHGNILQTHEPGGSRGGHVGGPDFHGRLYHLFQVHQSSGQYLRELVVRNFTRGGSAPLACS